MTKRFVAAALSLVLAMLVLLGIPFLRTVEKFERERLRLELVNDAVAIGARAEDLLSEDRPIDASTSEAIHTYADQTATRVVIVDRKGSVWADTAGPIDSAANVNSPTADARSMKNRPEFISALQGNFAAITRPSATLGYTSLFVAVPVSSSGIILGATRVNIPTLSIDQRIAVQRTHLIGFGLAMATLVTLFAIALSRWLGKPIADLHEATRQVGAGRLATRARTNRGPSDLRLLASEFNAMAERLDDLMNTQQAFVADASHELRSPLTAIRLQIEAMEYDTAEGTEVRRQRALDEVNRLSRNVDGLLVLARQDQSDHARQRTNVSDLVSARAEFWSSLIQERELRLSTQIHHGLHTRLNPDRFITVFDNLISNAIEAAPPSSTISVTADSSQGRVVVHIVDNGPGMSPQQRIAAFDRFWRATTKRTALGGSGLGLAIARKLVAADHGTIRLDEALPSGIDAVLTYNQVS